MYVHSAVFLRSAIAFVLRRCRLRFGGARPSPLALAFACLRIRRPSPLSVRSASLPSVASVLLVFSSSPSGSALVISLRRVKLCLAVILPFLLSRPSALPRVSFCLPRVAPSQHFRFLLILEATTMFATL